MRVERTIREGSLAKGQAIGLEKGLAEGKAQRNQLKAERDQLQTERNQLQAKSNQLQAKSNQLQTERNQLQAERDQLENNLKNIVLNSRKADLSIETISGFTGLSPQQIEEILKSLNS